MCWTSRCHAALSQARAFQPDCLAEIETVSFGGKPVERQKSRYYCRNTPPHAQKGWKGLCLHLTIMQLGLRQHAILGLDKYRINVFSAIFTLSCQPTCHSHSLADSRSLYYFFSHLSDVCSRNHYLRDLSLTTGLLDTHCFTLSLSHL